MENLELGIEILSETFFAIVYDIFQFLITGLQIVDPDIVPSGFVLLWAILLVLAIGVVGVVFSLINNLVRRIFN